MTVLADRTKFSTDAVIGIDNGCTGTVSLFHNGELVDFFEQFSYKWRKPHVKKRNSYMSRIDYERLSKWLTMVKMSYDSVIAVIERPMTDETRLQQTISSHHAQEAVMIALESHGIPFMTVDSSEWQKRYLEGVSGSKLLKKSSMDRASSEYPKFCEAVTSHGDGDAIYIARMVVDGSTEFVPDFQRVPFVEGKMKKRKFITNF